VKHTLKKLFKVLRLASYLILKNTSYHIHKGREETMRRKIENANLLKTDYLFELRLMFAKVNG